MFMTEGVRRNLELDYIFGRLTVYTPYGEQQKKAMKPYLPQEMQALKEELDRIGKVLWLLERERYTFVEIRNVLKHVKDLRGSFKRIEENIPLTLVELFELKVFVGLLEKLTEQLTKLKWEIPQELQVIALPELKALLDPQNSGVNTFYSYEDYSEVLRELRREMKEIDTEVNREKVQAREQVQEQLKVKIRPNGEIVANKSNKEFIETLEACEGLTYSAETYMNITYKVKTDERVDGLLKKLEELKLLEEEEEFRVRQRLTQEMGQYIPIFQHNIQAIGGLDLLIAKAYLAVGMEGVKPQITEEERIEIIEGRHIKVADSLKKQGKTFTPITVSLKQGVTCITGANMGGKTISLKLIGLLVAMAQYGLFVPAREMTLSLKEFIFFSLGDLQSVDMGLSTFGAEILEIRRILQRASQRGLILIDELARGTNPAEGYAISKAIIQYLKNQPCTTLITTHFDGLTEDRDVVHLQVRGLSGVDYKQLKETMAQQGELGIELVHQYMDYRLEVIDSHREIPRDAIHIARLMGLDEEILQQAEKYLE